MKRETLNGVLTFVLGVLVALGVIFALRVYFVTRDTRALQSQVFMANNRVVQARALLAATAAYYQKNPSVELQRILQPFQPATPKP